MTAVADSNNGTTAVITSSQVENFIHDTIEPRENWFNRWFPFLKWSPSSPEKLKQAEEELLSCKLDILFSSNHNIHKSLYGLCFWASDPLTVVE